MTEKNSTDFLKDYFGVIDEDENMVSADDLIPAEEIMNGEE